MDEPSEIIAGDSVSWSRTLSAYPADAGWAVNYRAAPMNGAGAVLSIDAAGSGTLWSVNLAAASTALFAAGDYFFSGTASLGADRYTFLTTALRIRPDPTSAVVATHASRTLALIEAAIENRLPRALVETSIDGQLIARTPLPQLLTLRDRYRAMVLAEQTAARSALGLKTRRTIGIRFSRPS